LFHADGLSDVAELIVTFLNFAKAPKEESNEKLETRPNTKVFNRIGTEELRERLDASERTCGIVTAVEQNFGRRGE
jgi:hypothetical protein